MSKKKMCPLINDREKCWKAMGNKKSICHTRCDDDCCIIPKKPKMVRVKAWVDVFDYVVWEQKKEGVCYLYHDKIDGISCYPVTILIDEKYLRRKL